MNEPISFDEVRRMQLKPGDVIVLRLSDDRWEAAVIEDFRDMLGSVFPDHKVVILAHGVDLEIIEPEEPA